MTSVPQLSATMHELLTNTTNQLARSSGFAQRRSKMSGAGFVQTLLWGWQSNPQATLEELAQTAATCGFYVSAQAIDQRFTPQATELLRQVLLSALSTVAHCEPVAVELLQKFSAVLLLDSTIIALPDALADQWSGCSNRTGSGQAALKVSARLDLCSGELLLELMPGRAHDRTGAFAAALQDASARVAVGALRLADVGYFSLDVLHALDKGQSYWISRIQTGTAIYSEDGCRWELGELLGSLPTDQVELDWDVELGVQHRLPSRLLAVRVSSEVAEQRRRALHMEARRRGQRVSQRRLAVADWTVYVTNVPHTTLTLQEALVLVRARWQIELLFKLWKSHGRVDEWRTEKPERIMCEVYAKLLGLLVQHWFYVVSCWSVIARSLSKAALTVQRHALHLASAFAQGVRQGARALQVVKSCLLNGCRINKRKTKPHTWQLLLDPSLATLA